MTQGNIAILLESMLQTWGFFLTDSLDPVEINLHLDKGVQDFIEETLTGLRNRGSFESNSVRLDDLQQLKKTSDPITVEASTNPPEFKLPIDYNDYIKVRVNIAKNEETNCPPVDTYSKARIIQSDVIDELLEDTYHKSTIRSPVGEIENDKVRIHPNGFTVKDIVVQYIKSPEKFDIGGKKDEEYPLPDSAINRILDKVAVELAKVLENMPKAQALQQNKLI